MGLADLHQKTTEKSRFSANVKGRLRAQLTPMTSLSLRSRIHGCWLGKSIGGTLGLPTEGKRCRLNLSFYDPVPTKAPPNDDLELQLVWLDLLEKGGGTLSQEDFARAWREHIHYMWDEYGRCRWNLRRGVPADLVGTFENPFHAAMGSPIRSEIWACLFGCDLESVAHYAALDASLDHGAEGIAGEVLFAVMQAAIIGGCPVEEASLRALDYLPPDCETIGAIKLVRENYLNGVEAWECWGQLLEQHGHENFTHAPLNVALTLWALWYGGGDFEKSILLATNAGYDTDCTAATVGATLGMAIGAEQIPSRWSDPIGSAIYIGPGIIGINAPNTLEELTERTLALIGKLEPHSWNPAVWFSPMPNGTLAHLPGTISVKPLHHSEAVAWANGELPQIAKSSGGAEWIWEHQINEPRVIVCLARQGAKLFLNGELLVECPAGIDFVPAPHRGSSAKFRAHVNPGVGAHRLRLELNDRKLDQDVSVILTYPNLHLAPWSAEELPHKAMLP